MSLNSVIPITSERCVMYEEKLGNKNVILSGCKFLFWFLIVHGIDPSSIEHSCACIHRVKWSHIIYGKDTIAILWV